MKFADVLIIETRVVEEARVRAEVNSAHIRALKARLREKKNCCQERVSGGSFSMSGGKRRELEQKALIRREDSRVFDDIMVEDVRHESVSRQSYS